MTKKSYFSLGWFVSAALVVCAIPDSARAQAEQSSTPAKSKRHSKAKTTEVTPQQQVGEDPYAQDGQTVETDLKGATAAPGAVAEGSLRRSGRMEFDERLVKGQAAKSGAVYLFKRTPRSLPGLVPLRRSYRTRITRPVLGEVVLKPVFTHTTDKAEPSPAQAAPEAVAAPAEPKPADEAQPAQAGDETDQSDQKKSHRKKKKSRKRGEDQ